MQQEPLFRSSWFATNARTAPDCRLCFSQKSKEVNHGSTEIKRKLILSLQFFFEVRNIKYFNFLCQVQVEKWRKLISISRIVQSYMRCKNMQIWHDGFFFFLILMEEIHDDLVISICLGKAANTLQIIYPCNYHFIQVQTVATCQ